MTASEIPGRSGATRRWRGRWLPLLVLLMVFPVRAAPETAPAAEAGLVPLRLMLSWQPQAQFAGYYVAREQGFYREAGIELTILGADGERSTLAALRAGEADLGILWLSTAIHGRADGVPLVNVAQLFQHSSVMLIARADSGVRQLSDLQGRRVGVWMGDPALPVGALLREQALEVRRVPQATTVNLFLRGGVEAMSGMFYNEYHLLINAGLEPRDLTLFRLSEHGIDFPEDGLYVLEQTLRERSDAIAAFVAATRRGWERAFADPEGTLDLVLQHQRTEQIPANRAHQRWMLEQVRAVMGEPGEAGWDWRLRLADAERVGQALHRLGMIDAVPDDLEGFGGQ